MEVSVEVRVRVFEEDGEDTKGPDDDHKITVESHWNREDLVVIGAPGWGQTYTVRADALIDAARRCSR